MAGFTMMELMVTVVIIGILAAVSMPVYADYVIRGRIPQATATLGEMRVKMEQYFQDNRTYTGACAGGALAEPPINQPDFNYTCSIPNGGATFTLKAEGKDKMTGFTYQVNESNARSTESVPTGWGSAPYNCWVTNRGGKC